MGISGLLPNLKSIQRNTHVREYAGHRVAIDGYCWLHRGVYSCSRELCEGRPTRKYVEYCMRLVKMLQSHGVTPLVVFDGGKLPSKVGEEAARERSRKEHHEKALAHLRAGNTAAANECFQRAVDVTPRMAACVIEELNAAGVPSLVAPYEADVQMAYLALNGFVHAVVTEDSDLLVYGVPRVFFKMDHAGSGVEIRTEDLPLNRELCLSDFGPEQFMEMCIMSGCDYLRSINGVGVKRAHGYIQRFRSYTKALRHMRLEGLKVPPDYQARFAEALLTFRHQWVYCPKQEDMVTLHPVAAELGGPAALASLIGVAHATEVARGVANGRLDPMTLRPFSIPTTSVASASLNVANVPGSARAAAPPPTLPRSKSMPAQKNTLSRYFESEATKEAITKPFNAPTMRPPPQVTSVPPLLSGSAAADQDLPTDRLGKSAAPSSEAFACSLNTFRAKRRCLPSVLPPSSPPHIESEERDPPAQVVASTCDGEASTAAATPDSDPSPIRPHPMSWKAPMRRIVPQIPSLANVGRSNYFSSSRHQDTKERAEPADEPSGTGLALLGFSEGESQERQMFGLMPASTACTRAAVIPKSDYQYGNTAHLAGLEDKASDALEHLQEGTFDRFRCRNKPPSPPQPSNRVAILSRQTAATSRRRQVAARELAGMHTSMPGRVQRPSACLSSQTSSSDSLSQFAFVPQSRVAKRSNPAEVMDLFGDKPAEIVDLFQGWS